MWMLRSNSDRRVGKTAVSQSLTIHKPAAIVSFASHHLTVVINNNIVVVIESQPLKWPQSLPAFAAQP